MTKTAAIRFLRRNSLGTIPRSRATVVAKVFGRTLSDLGPVFGRSGPVSILEFACALAGIEVEIPTHLVHLISQWNTECATLHLERAVYVARGGRVADGPISARRTLAGGVSRGFNPAGDSVSLAADRPLQAPRMAAPV